ncbi:putative membrane protein [Aequitasia blattaphilus]|uniref:Glutamine amidotransferase n=1 Tax=Aequitasia blattaphilus TaxID=2949332 RepID=A0ABT1EC11_9FIRM|nr:glutamine amidotransferase [Aequitasia blattaphilus]MCP1103179.1 glutamine amidotransferase [Aequitasia blattaphilus]MCR8615819.1 glutamine amidotransferase [Aequitasia blattaphilus]
MKKILLAGESWMSYTTHVKGFDSFYTSAYETGEKYLKRAYEDGGYEFIFMPNHLAAEEFPFTIEELSVYDMIILSDIGANTLLLPGDTFTKSIKRPNRCNLIRDYVRNGGALLMVGGYLTFSGVDGKGKWQDTAVQEVLPVQILSTDDRMEHCEGITPVTTVSHEILEGLGPWPNVLGYNRTLRREEGTVIAEVEGNPFLAIGEFGKGRSAAFTTDCAPHWAPPEFCEWKGYNKLFVNIAKWLMKEEKASL